MTSCKLGGLLKLLVGEPFPALERYLVDQLIDFYLILSMRLAKMSLFFLPKCSGNPKYFPTPPSFWILRKSFTQVFTSLGVLAEKVIADFPRFMHCPEAPS